MAEKDQTRQWINVIAIFAVIIVNVLANTLPINGVTTGEISSRFDVYFKPAAYAFSIWTIIYLLLVGFAVYQALPSQKNNQYVQRIGYLFAISSLLNIAWIFLWHYQLFALSLLAMVLLLVSLIGIYLRLDIGRIRFNKTERIAISIPFSIYLAWVSVATIANATILLEYINWNGWGISEETWAVLILIVTIILGSVVTTIKRDIAFAAVFIWALIAIAIRQEDIPSISITAAIGAAILAFVASIAAIRYRRWIKK